MRAFLFFAGFVVISILLCKLAHAKSIDPSGGMQLVNDKLWMLQESGSALTAEEVMAKYEGRLLTKNTVGQVSYGFTNNTIWGVLPVDINTYGEPVTSDPHNLSESFPFLPLVIEIDNAWLDDIDVYFFENGERKHHVTLGDNQIHSARAERARMPSVFIDLPSNKLSLFSGSHLKTP